MSASCLSIVSLYGSYLRRCLSAAGLNSQTIEIDDQTTMHFYGPNPNNSPTKPKPPLLLIHGFGANTVWQWRQQIVFFCLHYHLYVPNLVFFGESTSKSDQRSEVFQAECVGKLMEKLGVGKYWVVGTSYGGFVAYNMARMWPERIEKVVIASSGLNYKKSNSDELLRRAQVKTIEELMLPTTAAQLRTLIGLSVYRRLYVPSFFLNDLLHNLYGENRKEKEELLKGLTLGRDENVNISPLNQEVLIIWGDHDKIFHLDMANELKRLLGEKVKLEVIQNTSHVPQLEHAAQFNDIVQKFLCGFE